MNPITANDLTELNLLGWDPASSTKAPAVTTALAHATGSNNVTSNDALTGAADPNATVTLSEGSTVLGTATANASGVWSFTPTGLAQGTQTITASETNAAGLTGSSSLTFTYDTVAPVAPHITTDTVNTNNTVTLSGSAEANATVTLYDNGATLGTTTANASGSWSYTTGVLASGTQSLTATATDAAANTSVASSPVSVVIGPAGAPLVTIALAHDTGASTPSLPMTP